MHIISVTIENFASYQELTIDANVNLSIGCNLILGKNGSGKSSFFKAIAFVLSDQFKHLSKQEKRSLLYGRHGQNQRNVSANRDKNTFAVEIKLDNSASKPGDQAQQPRLPIMSDTVVLRKTYNCNTDREDYFLNGRHTTEKEIYNVFESAGYFFNQGNQFKFVEQGQLPAMCNTNTMFQILLEVTGTKAFDEKMTNMQTARAKCLEKSGTIQNILEEINEKLQTLKLDNEGYEEQLAIEKKKNAYQKKLYINKIKKVEQELAQKREEKTMVMAEREKLEQSNLENQDESDRERLEQIRADILALEAKCETLQNYKKELLERARENAQQNTMMDLTDETDLNQLERSLKQGLLELEKETQIKKQEQLKLQSQYEALEVKISQLQQERNLLEMNKEAADQFKDPKKREKFFQDEITKLTVQLASVINDQQDLQKQQQNSSAFTKELEMKIKDQQAKLKQFQADLVNVQKEITQARESKKQVAIKVKQMMFEHNEDQQSVKAMQTKLQSYHSIIDKVDPIFCTLRRIAAKAKEQKITGFKGFIADYFTCDKAYAMPVDIIAKQKLFAIVVDTTDTAQKILQINKEIKGGVINIFPIETMDEPLSNAQRKNPSSNSHYLSEFIQIQKDADPKVRGLIHKMFKKTLLVDNYSLALELAADKENPVNCITPDLQVVYAGAFITRVGYQQRHNNSDRISTYSRIKILQTQVDERLENQKYQTIKKSELADEELQGLRKMQTAELKLHHISAQQQEANLMLNDMTRLQREKLNSIQNSTPMIESLQREQQKLEEEIKILEKNKKKTKGATFTPVDMKRLIQLNKDINNLQLEVKEKLMYLNTVASKIESNESIMNETFKKKLSDVMYQIQTQNLRNQNKTENQKVQENLESEIRQVTSQLINVQENLQQKQAEAIEFFSRNVASQDNNIVEQLQKKASEVQTLGIEIGQMLTVLEDTNLLIRKLGVISESEFQLVTQDEQQFDESKLRHLISQTAQTLGAMPRRNRHSAEWLTKYQARYEKLTESKGHQDATSDSIQQLLNQLDQRREKLIKENFQQLKQRFESIFSEVTASGEGGEAVLSLASEDNNLRTSSQLPAATQAVQAGTKLFTGLKLDVEFGSKQMNLESLSGGQKTVVLLCFLLAVQEIESQPFYLLDEYDHALDGAYANALAKKISQLSENSQFIITTFKEHLVPLAQQRFEVKYANGKSQLVPIKADRALTLIKQSANLKNNSQKSQ